MHFRSALTHGLSLALFAAVTSAVPAAAQDANESADLSYFANNEDASAVSLTALQEPAEALAPRETPPRPAPRRGPGASRQASFRLASVPNMFGDVFMTGAQVLSENANSGSFSVSSGGFDVPSAGGSRRVKIGENNKALPTDRVYFMYNHFENALSIQQQSLSPPGPNIIHQAPIDRYTFGIEKMFCDDLWSCEIRMPLNSSFNAELTDFGVGGGNVGNLAVIVKNLLYADESTSIAAGLGIDLPTGSDVDGRVGATRLAFENDAVHLLPYVGFVHSPGDRWFALGFWQVDIATGGNEVLAGSPQGLRSIGNYNEQNLMFFDLSVGRWLYRDPYAQRLTSIALLGEVHYTTTLQDSDQLRFVDQGSQINIANLYNRQDVVNGTVALQFEIASTTAVRVAGVFPFGERADERFFDAELQVQINRQF